MIKQLLKKILPANIRKFLKTNWETIGERCDLVVFFLSRKAKKTRRKIFCQSNSLKSRYFYILAIRRKEYIKQAIFNINSLHYYNANHRVRLHVDEACAVVYQSIKKQLDYPSKVEIVVMDIPAKVPWQQIKIDLVFDAGRNDALFVDADERWFADPTDLIPTDQICFLTKVNIFEENRRESIILRDGLNHQNWLLRTHYNTGFVSIPRIFAVEEFELKVKEIYNAIINIKRLQRLSEEEDVVGRRYSEEIALSLAAQEIFNNKQLTVLKESDNFGDRNILQSYYYGCLNNVL